MKTHNKNRQCAHWSNQCGVTRKSFLYLLYNKKHSVQKFATIFELLKDRFLSYMTSFKMRTLEAPLRFRVAFLTILILGPSLTMAVNHENQLSAISATEVS